MQQNIIYKIYIGRKCAYIGCTTNDLTATLRVHFFNDKDEIDINRVSKIEYAMLQSYADCLVYKTYYINSIKPIYNKSEKARDEISSSIVLPDLNFIEYNNPIIDKWKNMLKA